MKPQRLLVVILLAGLPFSLLGQGRAGGGKGAGGGGGRTGAAGVGTGGATAGRVPPAGFIPGVSTNRSVVQGQGLRRGRAPVGARRGFWFPGMIGGWGPVWSAGWWGEPPRGMEERDIENRVLHNPDYRQVSASPQLRDYSNANLPAGPTARLAPLSGKSAVVDESAIRYRIALKNGVIQAATGYWIERDTLFYVTPTGGVREVPMADVDREQTDRLNQR